MMAAPSRDLASAGKDCVDIAEQAELEKCNARVLGEMMQQESSIDFSEGLS